MATGESQRRPLRTFVLLVCVRVVNALVLRTFFQPDEYYQALEPAWHAAFGPASGAWLTWEWHHMLRSSMHPLLFAAAYRVAAAATAAVPALQPLALLLAPRLLQAVLAATTDWATWRLAVVIFGPGGGVPTAALLLSVLSPWHWYCATRTFSNSLETTLTALALALWPWALFAHPPAAAAVKENSLRVPAAALCQYRIPLRASLVLAATAVVLRPTNVLIWLAVGATTLYQAAAAPKAGSIGRLDSRNASAPAQSLTPAKTASQPSPTQPRDRDPAAALVLTGPLLREATVCGLAVLAVSALCDRLYFGRWVLPPARWLHFNLVQSLAVFYGRSPWHYYLIQALPQLTTTALPFALVALLRRPPAHPRPALRILAALRAAVVTTAVALSCITHKEVRFLYPLLPLLHVLAAPHLVAFFIRPPADSCAPSPLRRPTLRRTPLLYTLVALNLLLAAYLSLLHQSAPLAVLAFLRREYARTHGAPAVRGPPPAAPADSGAVFAAFLTPCHSTPWRSHLLHADLTARALTCEPPLQTPPGSAARHAYRDEADRFFNAPVDFLRAEWWPRAAALPRYIVAFEPVEPALCRFVNTSAATAAAGVSLTRVWAGWNGLFHDDPRRAGRLVVWQCHHHGAAAASPAGLEP